jgi:hypothetical protein
MRIDGSIRFEMKRIAQGLEPGAAGGWWRALPIRPR